MKLVNASKMQELDYKTIREIGIPFEKKFTQFSDENIKQIADTYHNWQTSTSSAANNYDNIPEYCYSATKEEIAKKDYSLVPSKYIEFVNRDENIDFDTKMKTLQSEFKELLIQEEQSKKDLLEVFKKLGYEINYEQEK